MPIRIIDKVARVGRIQTSLGSLTALLSGTHVAPPSRTGVITASVGTLGATLVGVFTPAANRTGTISASVGTLTSTLVGTSSLPASSVFPLSVSGHQIRDKNGNPFFICGDTPWSWMVGLTDAESTQYLNDRQSRGVNALIVNSIEHQFTANPPNTVTGIAPFTTQEDIRTPNNVYFNLVLARCQAARTLGMAVLITPAYLGFGGGSEGWWSAVSARTTTECQTYGAYLGTKFAALDNLIWVMGGDYYAAATLTRTQAIVAGLKSTGNPNWLFTYHADRTNSSADVVNAETWLNLNAIYTDDQTIGSELETGYGVSTVRPTIYFEGYYEGEGATAQELRAQAYMTILTGGMGAFFGNSPIWKFGFGWQSALNSAGMQDRQRWAAFFKAFNWFNLVPDRNDTVLTSGQGSLASMAYAARMSDGSKVVVYTPTQKALTIALSQLVGTSGTASWYNPSTGATTAAGTTGVTGTQVFTPPSSGDWILVIDAVTAVFNPSYPLLASYAIGGTQNANNAALAERVVNIVAYGATWAQRKGVTLEAKASAVKALSTVGTKMVPYVIHVDVYDGFAAAGNDFYEWYTVLTTNQWFVYNNGVTHDTKVVGSSAGYSKPNYTTSCPLVAGDTAFKWKAKWDYKLLYTGGTFFNGTNNVTVQGTSSLDGKYDDNIFARERSNGDYAVVGSSQSVSSQANISLIQSSHAANLAYWKTLAPTGSLALANCADWPAWYPGGLAGTALDQLYDGGVMENITEYYDGPRGTTAASLFNAIKVAQDAFRGPKLGILRLQLASATDYARLRFWTCVACLTGTALYEHVNAGYLAEELGTINWDEKTFKLGQPSAGSAGAVQWAAQAGGHYRRDFANGVVLLNASTAPITVSLGGTFYRLLGTFDPTTNNGQSVTSVTMPAGTGLVLARVSQDNIAPSVPTSLSASAVSSSQINLTWMASTDTGGSGMSLYRIERSANGTSGWSEIGTSATTSYSDAGRAASTQYFYRVRAEDAAGNRSGYSNTANATTQAGATLDPVYVGTFASGTIGALANAEYQEHHGPGTVYANDVAGPKGEPQVGKVLLATNTNYYGSRIRPRRPISTIAGTETWFRGFSYFRSQFCCGGQGVTESVNGSLKWWRWEYDTANRLTLLLGDPDPGTGVFTQGTCATPSVSPFLGVFNTEIGSANADLTNPRPIFTRDTWLHDCVYILWGNPGRVRIWHEDILKLDAAVVTRPSGAGFDVLTDGLWWPGDYYNGRPLTNESMQLIAQLMILDSSSPPPWFDPNNPTMRYIPKSVDARDYA